MKFEDEMIKTKFYTTYKSLPKSRKKIIESDTISNFKQKMFDLYDVEDIFVVGDFLLKESVSSKPTLYLKMRNSMFSDFLDRRNEFIEDFNVVCEVQNSCYNIADNKIIECIDPEIRVQLPNEKYY